MDKTELRILETALVIIVLLLSRLLVFKYVDRTVRRNLLHKTRGKVVKKIIYISMVIIAFCFTLIIWGVRQSEIFLFMSSVLAVVGIALFAQWSLLSNITAGLIIFFNHSLRLEDDITIMDKDYEIDGRISDIGLFFIVIKTKDGNVVTLPSNLLMQKMILRRRSKPKTEIQPPDHLVV